MASISSLAPLAQKALALSMSHKQTTLLPPTPKASTGATVDQCKKWTLPFVIDADIRWHWENGQESLEKLLKKYNEPVQSTVDPLAFRNKRIVLPQPCWDLTGDPKGRQRAGISQGLMPASFPKNPLRVEPAPSGRA